MTIHDERFSLSCSTSPFTSFHTSPFFFQSFLSMYSNNFDSMTNNLRNSANATFVTSDDTFPLTHHTCNYEQCCFVVILQNNADWDCSKTSISREILKTQNQFQVEHFAFSEVIHFFTISWMWKKQTSESLSSTDSEIISLDVWLRLDGIPALDSWDLIVSVFGNTIQTRERLERPVIIDKRQIS